MAQLLRERISVSQEWVRANVCGLTKQWHAEYPGAQFVGAEQGRGPVFRLLSNFFTSSDLLPFRYENHEGRRHSHVLSIAGAVAFAVLGRRAHDPQARCHVD